MWWSIQHDNVVADFKNELSITGSIGNCEEPDTWEILPRLSRGQVGKSTGVLASPDVYSIVFADFGKVIERISSRCMGWQTARRSIETCWWYSSVYKNIANGVIRQEMFTIINRFETTGKLNPVHAHIVVKKQVVGGRAEEAVILV